MASTGQILETTEILTLLCGLSTKTHVPLWERVETCELLCLCLGAQAEEFPSQGSATHSCEQDLSRVCRPLVEQAGDVGPSVCPSCLETFPASS